MACLPACFFAEAQTVTLRVDATQVTGLLNKSFNQCVGAGRANEGLRADWQRQLSYIKSTCDFKYIRMHGLLDEDMGVYREDSKGHPVYNWQYIDEMYDFLIRIHMKPFVELGFMPDDLASGKQCVFWYRGNVTPPKDYQKWADLIGQLVSHWTERYGQQEVKTWYFEVWNEPNLSSFWTGSKGDYFHLYQVTATVIKTICPEYKVGGPATAAGAWVPEFIQFCKSAKAPVDFVSTHSYGVESGFLDQMGNRGTVLSYNKNAVSGDMIRTREQIKSSSLPDLELHYTEWSSSYTPADPIHDSYHEAAYILDKVKQAGESVNSMSYWTFTDIFEEPGPRAKPFHGGFGLMNYQDICKPAFYAFRFLNQLGDSTLQTSSADPGPIARHKGSKNEVGVGPDHLNSIVTKSGSDDFQTLFWDFTITHPTDSVNNQVYYRRDLPSRSKGSVRLSITHLPEGRFLATVYKIGYRSNDPYATYMDLGSPSQLTLEQVKAIRQINDGSPLSSQIVMVSSGTFEQVFSLRENDVYLITLHKLP